jgi:hypothetical protein
MAIVEGPSAFRAPSSAANEFVDTSCFSGYELIHVVTKLENFTFSARPARPLPIDVFEPKKSFLSFGAFSDLTRGFTRPNIVDIKLGTLHHSQARATLKPPYDPTGARVRAQQEEPHETS